MSKALVTFAVGDHERLLELALPRFEDYADRHGYDVIVPDPVDCNRPPSWWKVPVLHEVLAEYGEALWIDCDVAIVRGDEDIATEIPDDAWQALVAHLTPDGEVPNLGVWFLRRDMRPVLDHLWKQTQYVQHPWWEQAAMLDELGYQHHDRPCRLVETTGLYDRTTWLDLSWNSHEQNDRHPNPRFAHITPNSVDWRLPIMERYLSGVAA